MARPHASSLDLGLLFMRIGFGAFLILFHGWEKVSEFQQKTAVFPDPLGLGRVPSLTLSMLTEVGCGSLIILGLFTRLAAVPLLFTMVVIASLVHKTDPWITKELAYLYALAFGTLFIAGPGQFSLDAKRD